MFRKMEWIVYKLCNDNSSLAWRQEEVQQFISYGVLEVISQHFSCHSVFFFARTEDAAPDVPKLPQFTVKTFFRLLVTSLSTPQKCADSALPPVQEQRLPFFVSSIKIVIIFCFVYDPFPVSNS